MRYRRGMEALACRTLLERLGGGALPEWDTFARSVQVRRLQVGATLFDAGVPWLWLGVVRRGLVKLVYLTMNHDPDMAGEAFRLGASAYLLKNSAAVELQNAIREVVRGGFYVTPLMTKGMDGSFVQNFKLRKSTSPLTLRQKEVLQLLAEGRSMKEVAFVLNVSPRTVAFHKYTMMEHLQIRSNAELIEYAMRSSIVAAA